MMENCTIGRIDWNIHGHCPAIEVLRFFRSCTAVRMHVLVGSFSCIEVQVSLSSPSSNLSVIIMASDACTYVCRRKFLHGAEQSQM